MSQVWALKALKWLREQDKHYYSGVEKVSDDKYDSIKKKLSSLDGLSPKLRKEINSYLLEVGAEVSGKKAPLPIPMGGIDQIPAEGVQAWIAKFKKYARVVEPFFFILPKLDGISILLHYKEGKLVGAYTRGRKKPGDKVGTGKPVKMHVGYVQGVPKTISFKKEVFVRGEAVCHEKNFALLQGREFEGSPKGGYKFSRGFVSGMFNRDSLTTLQKKLMRRIYIIAFSVIIPGRPLSLWKQHEFIRRFGFRCITSPNPINKKFYYTEKNAGRDPSLLAEYNEPPCPHVLNIGDKVSEDWLMSVLAHYRNTIDIKQDGLVIELCQKEIRSKFPDEGNFPEYAVKVKPKRSQQTSAIGILGSIEWNYTSRRLYVPVAILEEPVNIDGVSISRFSLHNYANIKKLGLFIGCKVKCVRAGDVIPHIEEVIN